MRILHKPILSILFSLIICCSPASAQTFSVIHVFTGQGDGGGPAATLTIDGGILYGTTAYGGGVNGRNCDPQTIGCGVVFQMTQHSGGWILTPLYKFTGFNDGQRPMAPAAFGPGGRLYGSTIYGGNVGVPECNFGGCGVIFSLHPTASACHSAICDWIETPIYQFTSLDDGYEPRGDLAFDGAGNVYGTTVFGGTTVCGTNPPRCGNIFQLMRSGSGWTKTTLYNFHDGTDGAFPTGGVIIDRFGVLYGVAESGGAQDHGAVFALTPSGSGWTETILYSFQDTNDGGAPFGGLVMDADGNLYGTTSSGGSGGGGTVFELSPSGGGWTFSVLASFNGLSGDGPYGGLAFDSAGDLYGTTRNDGAFGWGNVFKLTHSGGQWIYADLYDFTNGNDGAAPQAGVTLGSNGSIYGTAGGGPLNHGVVWQITP